jgi:hypothetical protein
VKLKDEDWIVRAEAAKALGRKRVPEAAASDAAIQALRKAQEDPTLEVRSEAKRLLGGPKYSESAGILIQALRDKNLKTVAENYPFFLMRAEEGTEEILVAALNSLFGTSSMVQDFINCGNATLASAAEKWAYRNGYQIIRLPGGGTVRWGTGSPH